MRGITPKKKQQGVYRIMENGYEAELMGKEESTLWPHNGTIGVLSGYGGEAGVSAGVRRPLSRWVRDVF